MPAKKTPQKKRKPAQAAKKPKASPKKKAPVPSRGSGLTRLLLGLALLLAVSALAVYALQRFAPAPEQRPAPAPGEMKVPQTRKPRQAASPPVYEVFPETPPAAPAPEPVPLPKPAPAPAPGPVTAVPSNLPRVAIIVDDLGYDETLALEFLALPAPFAFSILPESPHEAQIARRAHALGRDVLLHLPMEPREYPRVNPGPGTLLVSMTPDELLASLDSSLSAVPFVTGVNNHMGSRFTAEPDALRPIFTRLKAQGLFFVDSYTAPDSRCAEVARPLQLPFAQRDVFLDHVEEEGFIRDQMAELVRVAKARGWAVGICHPHRLTLKVLSEILPPLKGAVQFVPVSELVVIQG
ncbi:MAG: divergent polysaccharide deacetylase family protein [Proteobacteria bacterium]|nr:divergent polysaccharide deacetylase family protein [Pseudomonadota bacterium]